MKNKLFVTSLATITGLYAILILFLFIVFELLELPIDYLVLTSIIVLIIHFLVAPSITDWVMKNLYKAYFDVEIPDYLKKHIEDICSKNGISYPKIGYINDGAPNAFTYGRKKDDARIILTKGIFNLLTPEEVKAVVSHELGHIAHYDMLLMTIVQIVPLILYHIYKVTYKTAESKSDNNDEGSVIGMIGLVAYILYIFCEYVILWFSRIREYYADEFAVITTGNPNSLVSALVKVGYGLTTNSNTFEKKYNPSDSALGIFDSKSSKALVVSSYDNGQISSENLKKAARWELWNPWAKWYEFNSTHPMITKRIKAISKYCPKYNQEVLIEFDEKKPESYVDDFLRELFINFLPLIVIITMVIMNLLSLDSFLGTRQLLGTFIALVSFAFLIRYSQSHKNYNYVNKKVSDLLEEVKVSSVTSIPCIVKGQLIGRGTPGFVLSEDFVLQDDTGIIILDYNQPLAIINKAFALLKSRKYTGKVAEIKGWYRRSPVPYIEIYTMTVEGEVKKCYTFDFTKKILKFLMILGLVLIILGD